MTRLKKLGRSGNYVPGRGYEFLHNVEEFFETILLLLNQSNACLELRDRDQAEFLLRRLEQCEQTLCVLYQRLTETSGNNCLMARLPKNRAYNCLSAFISCSTSCLIASWRGHVSVRRWYIKRKVCSDCSNLLDRNSPWSPSSNSTKHALLWLNKDKIVSKISSTLGMNKFIAAATAMLNFKARSFQTARALLTGSSPGLLDLWNCTNLTYIFYSFDEVVKAREKLYSIQLIQI